MTFPVSFNYPPRKGYLFSDHEDECFSFTCSTSGSSSNTANILARITGEVEEYDVIHIWKINSTWCPVNNFKRFISYNNFLFFRCSNSNHYAHCTSFYQNWSLLIRKFIFISCFHGVWYMILKVNSHLQGVSNIGLK